MCRARHDRRQARRKVEKLPSFSQDCVCTLYGEKFPRSEEEACDCCDTVLPVGCMTFLRHIVLSFNWLYEWGHERYFKLESEGNR